jgi:signal transduction histidine kinase
MLAVLEDVKALAVVAARAGRRRLHRMVIPRHIAERLAVEAALHAGEERLRVVSRRVVEVQEEERRRISRELHDSLGQSLTALHVGLTSVQKLDGCPPHVQERIGTLRELALRIDEEVDRLSFELRPLALDDLGLESGLRLLVDEWSAVSHIPVDLHVNGLARRSLPPDVETTVYRIVQEGLTNILKHAQATHVSMIVESRPGELLAIVEDDGIGFDPNVVAHAPGARKPLGIVGMWERAELAGGNIEIESAPGSGTTIYLHVPLAHGAKGAPG